MKVRLQINRAAGGWLVGIAALLVPLLAACTSSTPAPTATQPPTPTATGVTAPTATQPPVSTVTAVPIPTATQPPTATVTAVPTPTATPTPTPAPTATPAFDPDREIGTYQGVTFLVGEGSEATFTVGERLVRLPLPNDAVMRTMALSGEVYMDGRPSVIEIDLHQLSSDQNLRDSWVRNRMFPNDPIAVFTIFDASYVISALPGEFVRGEVSTGEIAGQLKIRGIEVPLIFEIEARDDGEVVFILGRTTFTWEEFQIPVPAARPVISVQDEVRVEVLLVVRPLKES